MIWDTKRLVAARDLILEHDVDTKSMMHDGIIRNNLNNYVLPFEDNKFDFIFSESVFEHVQNYSESS